MSVAKWTALLCFYACSRNSFFFALDILLLPRWQVFFFFSKFPTLCQLPLLRLEPSLANVMFMISMLSLFDALSCRFVAAIMRASSVFRFFVLELPCVASFLDRVLGRLRGFRP